MSSSNSEAFPISLRPWPTVSNDAESLPVLLRRLGEQRGAFRDITEESLEKEIKEEELPQSESESESEEENESVAQKKRWDELFKMRDTMLQNLSTAHNEALIALDFISLLLSKHSPAAISTMSPAVKDAMAPGSLGIDKSQVPKPSDSRREYETVSAKGWRMQSLNSAADTLLKAASRLEKEVKRETDYWQQVRSITNDGWSVRRIRTEGRTLGVRFGFTESSGEFQSRGFAALRSDNEGCLLLDPQLTREPKAVRIRVVKNGQTIGISNLPLPSTLSDTSVEAYIRRARNSLFEEELYHKISLETRLLLQYDVKIRDSVIILPLNPVKDVSEARPPEDKGEILIDLVPLQGVTHQQESHESNRLAQSIVLTFRLLLSYSHRQKLRQRSDMPPPLSARKRPESSTAIIRPLLNYFQYINTSGLLRNHLQNITRTLHAAGLKISATFMVDPMLSELTATIQNSKNDMNIIDNLITLLLEPIKSKAILSLPSSTEKAEHELVIETRTSLSPPTYGTEFTLVLPTPLIKIMSLSSDNSSSGSRRLTFTSYYELVSYLEFILSLDLTHDIIAAENSGWIPSDREPEVSTSFGIKTQKYIGVELNEGKLNLYWRRSDRSDKEGEVAWDGKDSEHTSKEGFRAVLKRFMEA